MIKREGGRERERERAEMIEGLTRRMLYGIELHMYVSTHLSRHA